MRRLYDEVEANVRALSVLGRNADKYGGHVLPLMFHKIPEEIRLSIFNKVAKENWNLEVVLKELKDELGNRKRCDYSAVSHSGDSKPAAREEIFSTHSWIRGKSETYMCLL